MPNHFDLLASIYDRVMGSPAPDRLRQLLKLPTDGWLLDAGGGTGRVSAQLKQWVDHLVVCDLSLPMLKEARQKGSILPIRSHIERLPFLNESFDRILVVDALHHFCDQQQAVGDLLRVLKPGGCLVIEEPDINRFMVKLVALAEKLTLMRSHFHTPFEIQDMFRSRGLSARIESDEGFAVWIIVEKPLAR